MSKCLEDVGGGGERREEVCHFFYIDSIWHCNNRLIYRKVYYTVRGLPLIPIYWPPESQTLYLTYYMLSAYLQNRLLEEEVCHFHQALHVIRQIQGVRFAKLSTTVSSCIIVLGPHDSILFVQTRWDYSSFFVCRWYDHYRRRHCRNFWAEILLIVTIWGERIWIAHLVSWDRGHLQRRWLILSSTTY